jgi:hypothetical protein
MGDSIKHMSDFKIFNIESIRWNVMPFIVTTAYTSEDCRKIAEWFLSIPDDDCSFFSQAIIFTEFQPGEILLDEDFMLKEALEQAKKKFRQYMSYHELDGKDNWPINILEDNRNMFVSLWLRSEYDEHLRWIFNGTNHVPLQELLRWVFSLKKNDYQDMPHAPRFNKQH